MIVVTCSAIIKINDQILLIQEYKPAAVGKWGLPGGKLEEGESLLECVRREVLEETGKSVVSEDLLCVVNKPNTHEGNTVVKFVFICSVSDERVQTAEHSTKLFDLGSIEKLYRDGLIRGDEVSRLCAMVLNDEPLSGSLIQVM